MKKIVALLLAMMMVLALCACGAKEEAPAEVAPAAPAAPAAAPDAAAPGAAPAAPAEAPAEAAGEASGEASGEIPAPEFYAPTEAYAKDFEGYRQYVIDAFATDPGAPEDLKASYNASFEAMTEDTMADTSVANLVDLGLIVSYEDFLAY